jgi:hypothetical protein
MPSRWPLQQRPPGVLPVTTLAWRRHADVDEKPEPPVHEPPVWPVLAELEIITADRRIRGWIAPEGERTSDWMNRGAEIELIGSVEASLGEQQSALPQPAAGASRHRFAAEEILFAVPPALPVGRHLRLHRRVHGIHFEIGPYEVHGRIHVRPGAQVGDYLLRSARVFVPITEVDLVRHGEPAFRSRLGVLIVNARHVTRLYSGETHDAVSAAVSGALPSRETAPPPDVTSPGPVEAAVNLEDDPEPVRGTIHAALAELAALREDGLITVREYRTKRSEIIARL